MTLHTVEPHSQEQFKITSARWTRENTALELHFSIDIAARAVTEWLWHRKGEIHPVDRAEQKIYVSFKYHLKLWQGSVLLLCKVLKFIH